MRAAVLTLILGAAALLPASRGQTLRAGPQVVTFFSDIDDTDQPYSLYLPKDYNPARKYPLVISLHGAGSNHRLNLRRVFGKGNLPGETDAEATRYFPPLPDVDYIVASPLARGTMGYRGIPEKDVLDVLADVKKRFSIDEDRVYLTGLSMGGGGTLWIGLTRPDLWAAIAPVCPADPQETARFAPNALNLPVHLFQGAADPLVPVEATRLWNEKLKALGTQVEYIEYPHVSHNSWDNAYKNAAIFDWFAQFKRNRFPEHVRFVTDRYRYNQAYWVRIDSLTPGTTASIDARLTATNEVEVSTSGLDAFTLTLPKSPSRVTVDGRRIAGRGLAFAKKNGAWTRMAAYSPSTGQKRPGLEGPIADAIASRYICVYGTLGATSEDELKERRATAERAATWSTDRARLLLSPPVMADKDVSPADMEKANLMLFGTKETNSVIAQMADRLPVELNAGAADYGLLYVYPNGNRYVLINSGLPWFTGADRVRVGLRFMPSPFWVLLGMDDFLLFKGSLHNPIESGRFDNSWKLPDAVRKKITATDAVKVKQL